MHINVPLFFSVKSNASERHLDRPDQGKEKCSYPTWLTDWLTDSHTRNFSQEKQTIFFPLGQDDPSDVLTHTFSQEENSEFCNSNEKLIFCNNPHESKKWRAEKKGTGTYWRKEKEKRTMKLQRHVECWVQLECQKVRHYTRQRSTRPAGTRRGPITSGFVKIVTKIARKINTVFTLKCRSWAQLTWSSIEHA